MIYIRYAIAVIFGALGLYFFVLNWIIFWNGFVSKKTAYWAPLVAGCFLCAASLIIPYTTVHFVKAWCTVYSTV